MSNILIGLGLILVGILFNSLPAIILGTIVTMLGAYVKKSEPIAAPKKIKTRHRVLMSEPPEESMELWQASGGFPAKGNFDKRGFLPLPEYGYSSPLEKLFFNFPVDFLKKK